MLAKAKEALQHAYAPYSHFPVGACLQSEDGALFSGCNVENASYPLGQCAETNALGALVVAGKKKIKEVVVITTDKKVCSPCGACLQRLFEFASPDTAVHLCNAEGKQQTLTLSELLPRPFESDSLGSS